MAKEHDYDDDDGGRFDGVREAFDLVKDYARQETVDPLRRLGGYLAWGVIGSLLLGFGTLFLAMAGLRALQTETGSALTGSLSWIPYLIVLVGTVAVVGISAMMITRGRD